MKARGETSGTCHYRHVSVLRDVAVQHLGCRSGKIYVDCTIGGGGHSETILERIAPDGRLVAIDRDADALRAARERLKRFENRVSFHHANFSSLSEILESEGLDGVDGILADLGISNYHIDGSGRGFSFNRDEFLDMRMDLSQSLTADTLIHSLPEKELADMIFRFGEERHARRIARAIARERKIGRIASGRRLAEIVSRALPPEKRRHPDRQRIHPATRTFMAIRIAVNRELESLEALMAQAPALLNPGGRLCVIAFHSLEDRIVKRAMKSQARACDCHPSLPQCVCGGRRVLSIVNRKAISPDPAEIARNPMARSAKLRVAEKKTLAEGISKNDLSIAA